MQYVYLLHKRKFLNKEQVKAACAWRDNPVRMFLAPSMFRIMHDVVFKELSAQEIEEKRGLAARSAKEIIRMILDALIECESIFMLTPEDRNEAFEAEKAYLMGNVPNEIIETIETYGLTFTEARFFLILKHANGEWLNKEAIFNRLFADRPPEEQPTLEILDVLKCHVNQKPEIKKSGWKIESGHHFARRLIREEVKQDKEAR